MKVFISSTKVDLEAYREMAIEVVNRYEEKPVAMEHFGARAEDATTVCEKEIRDCNVFIGIYAHRYGYIPDGETKSITQMEYELAKELGKDCLCFIVEKSYPWNPELIEMGKYIELKAFLEKVKKECVVEFFKSPDHFMGVLSSSLTNLISKQTGKPGREEGVCLIPRTPYPYMAHPYALPEHFTGRRAEMAMLSNWFFNEEQPMLVLEAIGGIGKSALSWAWLHQEIMEKAVKVDGVFWWSFYDEPFESFITQLYCYVTGKETTQATHTGELLSALNRRRFLLVLDGLERALRGYAGMEAMYIQEKKFDGDMYAENEWDKRQREPVHPQAGRFLQALCAGNTKTLMTTRLMPVSLEGIVGVKHIPLKGLSPEDTVSFFRSEGIKGTRAEMEQAGKVYDFHPLMLKLLASSIKRSRARDVKEAFSQNLIDQKEPHKILNTSFNLLSEEEQWVATRVAVFRGVFTFDAVKALAQEKEEQLLWQVIGRLSNLGFLFYDESRDRFDFHPILHSFLYRQLTSSGATGVHDLAVQYFQAFPEPENVVTLEDLTPMIEHYYHLAKTGKFDDALDLFYRIEIRTYYQLCAYTLIIELLRELFPNGEDRLPQLKDEGDQAWTLNALAKYYSLSGQPAKAVPLFLLAVKFPEKTDKKENLAIGLVNAAYPQVLMGMLSAASMHVQKSIFLCKKIPDECHEAIGHAEWRRVLAFQGRVKGNAQGAGAEFEFNKASKYFEEVKNFNWLCKVQAYSSLSSLMQARQAAVRPKEMRAEMPEDDLDATLSYDAMKEAHQALVYAEKVNHTPHPRDFIRAYGLLGEALIQVHAQGGGIPGTESGGGLEIHFYNEYFKQIVETLVVQPCLELHAAERCLKEALQRCRKASMIDFEPDILLALARLDIAQNKPPDETLLKEAFEIALRSNYRLVLADLHLFCGQVLLQFKEKKSLLGFTAVEHLQKTKEYALDVSDISHLYSPVNSTADEFYKDIPEYDMLKRGMTDEERIQNGYWVAYQIAEILLKT